MNDATPNKNPILRRIVPPLASIALATAFASLGYWQVQRAAEKRDIEALFEGSAPYTQLANLSVPTQYRPVEARGRYLVDEHVLIDNIVRNGRIGYFVISALETAAGEPLLLVNRGWVARPDRGEDRPDLSLDGEWRSLHGRVGHLPRVGIRSGEAFANPGDWPRIAVYPNEDEVAAQLGRPVLPFVLLLDPDEPGGFARDWRPQQAGPMRHYGYAVQWFALCLTVIALSVWHYRRGSFRP